ncbi:MAG: alpha/beta hydrolase [bacterium]|nr:alpha/beta hydrolase [bacterium]
MFHQRIMIPTSQGAEIALDAYVPVQPADTDTTPRPAIVICPGGGYRHLSQREAEPIALRFLMEGFNTFIVWYRIAPNRFPLPQQDAAAAMAYVRAHAQEFLTDPNRIAIAGFSAGGHLAGSIGTLWHRAEMWQEMGLKPENVKPNAMLLSYAVITAGEHAHRGSFNQLTGTEDVSVHQDYSVDGWVTENCPPAFLWHTFEDASVPVQNSLIMAEALARHGVLCELHLFPHGAHGASLCNRVSANASQPAHLLPEAQCWPQMAARFLLDVMKGE